MKAEQELYIGNVSKHLIQTFEMIIFDSSLMCSVVSFEHLTLLIGKTVWNCNAVIWEMASLKKHRENIWSWCMRVLEML